MASPEAAPARLPALAPIPLRTLTTLLSYECLIRGPRYKSYSLHDINLKADAPSFVSLRRNTAHPNRKEEAGDFSSAQLEHVFYQSRWQNRSIILAKVFQQFFLACAENQEVIVQIRNEQPKLVKACDVVLSHFHVSDLRQPHIENRVQQSQGSDTHNSYFTRYGEKSPKPVLVFPPPYTGVGPVGTPYNDDIFVVGMAHIEYGEMGLFGEPYFIGNGKQWQRSMTTKVCKRVFESNRQMLNTSNLSERQIIIEGIKECALKAMQRWTNRVVPTFKWCEYCGVGGENLITCVECEKEGKMIRFCGAEHQEKAWEVHKFTCEGNKAKGLWTAGQYCEYCGVGGDLITCRKCEKKGKFVKYCSAKHGKEDWKLHQFTCEPGLWDTVKRLEKSLIPRVLD
ncbi:hypothetical protein EAF04_004161 [Stromatinia cepivora]|nr:hypothetical protein EAF04_004161 [Stromatinia cepivora]